MTRATFLIGLAALFTLLCASAAPSHPLDPLTADEFRAAVEVLRNDRSISSNTVFPVVSLQEPAKAQVLALPAGGALPREAFVLAYDWTRHETHEGVINLDQKRVVEWQPIPNAEPIQTSAEYDAGCRLLRTNELWVAALQRRGITDPAQVEINVIPAGAVPVPRAPEGRLLRAAPMIRTTNYNTYAPVEGLVAVVDLTHQRVLEVKDRGAFPRSRTSMEIFSPSFRQKGEKLKPLTVAQPDGANFRVQDHTVSWDRWRFRYAMHPREGLVLYHISWQEPSGKLRPILYRASVSELLVPYADTDDTWSWRAFFDAGDYGLGYYAMPLRPGTTTAAHATLLSEVLPDQAGGAREMNDIVDIYERDAGLLWGHHDFESNLSIGPRARELVIGCLCAVGNYDYRFQWSFRQDGSIEFHVYLTGVMELKGTHAQNCEACAALAGQAGTSALKGEQAHGVLVADHLLAPHHQHFFNLRLDFDVDGSSNSVKELNLSSDRMGSKNPTGNAFSLKQTVFGRERDAVRDLNPASHRMWAVFNPSTFSELGHPSAYLIEPGMFTVPFLAPASPVRRQAGFADHHLFVTRYRDSERYAAGNYPTMKGPPQNVAAWARNNERILNQDVVVWYTLGVTHVARPEDFPVMPTAHTSVRFLPMGFFPGNPAMNVPD